MYGEEKSTEHIRYQSTHSHPSKGENRSQYFNNEKHAEKNAHKIITPAYL
jgi:hypothetical protein